MVVLNGLSAFIWLYPRDGKIDPKTKHILRGWDYLTGSWWFTKTRSMWFTKDSLTPAGLHSILPPGCTHSTPSGHDFLMFVFCIVLCTPGFMIYCPIHIASITRGWNPAPPRMKPIRFLPSSGTQLSRGAGGLANLRGAYLAKATAGWGDVLSSKKLDFIVKMGGDGDFSIKILI